MWRWFNIIFGGGKADSSSNGIIGAVLKIPKILLVAKFCSAWSGLFVTLLGLLILHHNIWPLLKVGRELPD